MKAYLDSGIFIDYLSAAGTPAPIFARQKGEAARRLNWARMQKHA